MRLFFKPEKTPAALIRIYSEQTFFLTLFGMNDPLQSIFEKFIADLKLSENFKGRSAGKKNGRATERGYEVASTTKEGFKLSQETVKLFCERNQVALHIHKMPRMQHTSAAD